MNRGLVAAVARAVLVMAVVTVLSLGGWVVVPLLWGWDPYVVTSGSMSPLVQRGDVVVASDTDRTIRPGTAVVIAPASPGGEPVTHRVVERLPDGRYRTKGDANPQSDSRLIGDDEILGQARLVVPVAGMVVLLLGRAAPVAGVVLIGASLLLPVLRRSGGPASRRPRSGRAHPDAAPRHATRVTSVTAVIAVAAVLTPLGTTVGTAEATFTSMAATSHSWAAGAFYNQMVIASGPVSYWRLGNTGTSTSDAMGTAAMTLVGTPTSRPGALRADPNRALGFAQNPLSYGTVSSSAHSFPTKLSVAGWIRATLPTVPRARAVFKGDATHLNYLMAWDSTGYRMRFVVELASNATRVTAEAPYATDSAWHFIVGTYDGSSVRLYLHGSLAATTAATGTLHTSTLPLTLSRNDGLGMTGDLDEVAIWNRDLTATEIGAFYNAGRP